MVRCLVTGIAGFIGSSIAAGLLERGIQVRGLDNLSTGKTKNLSGFAERIEFIEGDIRDERALASACEGIDCIFHEAAIASVQRSLEDPAGTQEVNVAATERLITAACRARVRRLVFASSSAIYGNPAVLPVSESSPYSPLSPYADQKLQCENLLTRASLETSLETVCLRYFNVYGPHQAADSAYSGVIATFARAVLNRKSLLPFTIFGSGTQTRDFVFIKDVVEANLTAMTAPPEKVAGESFNVGSGIGCTVLDIVNTLKEITGSDGCIQFAPARQGDVQHSIADISLAGKFLGYKPTVSLREGLEKTVSWMGEELAGRTLHCPSPQSLGASLRKTAVKKNSQTAGLISAIENDEFCLAYQPIMNIRTGLIQAAEVLLRHPSTGGIVGAAPLSMIQAAEEQGLIGILGEWVFNRACADAGALIASMGGRSRLCVNISLPQLDDRHFPLRVEATLRRYSMSAAALEFEITERALVTRPRSVRSAIRQLQEIGISVALDDFGAGHANLKHLSNIHVNRLKTDRSVLLGSSRRWPLLQAVVAFAKCMHLPVVAEGVETEAHFDTVVRAQCHEVQGFTISRPLALNDLVGELGKVLKRA